MASTRRGSWPTSWGVSPSMTAATPTPPNDSLYSLQPTRPSSVVILRKSKLRRPASAWSDSTLAIRIVLLSPPPLGERERTLALDAARGEALHHVLLQVDVGGDHRQRRQDGARHQVAPAVDV